MYLETTLAPPTLMPNITTCPTLDPEVCAALVKARDLIANEDDWCKAAFEDDGRRCMSTAIRDGAREVRGGYAHDLAEQTKRAVAQVLSGRVLTGQGEAGGRILGFNDKLKTTHADVMDLFARTLEGCG